ncbi:hypothetical protein J2X48_003733 [Bosea sp. BE271]|nr:hypothetical protein [Bosea robiniae]MDR6896496.1 hypothetical protein [Bosea sp. BE109]MDR7139894.1 hypothetical protein [Bosea sp. BE168]MDR7176792.1 hypothetical protein [Bosea sp. BE271]
MNHTWTPRARENGGHSGAGAWAAERCQRWRRQSLKDS